MRGRPTPPAPARGTTGGSAGIGSDVSERKKTSPDRERHDDAEGARADPPVALLALASAEQPLEVALLEVDGAALAFEGVRDPRHRRPPSPCGTRRARGASASGSSRP